MAENLRPIGGFYVRQRGPKPGNEHRWREPFSHRTLNDAFVEAERLARATGVSQSIVQEVAAVDPVFAEPPSEADRLREELAEAEDRRAALLAQIAAAEVRTDGEKTA